jgi:hypothetical protein
MRAEQIRAPQRATPMSDTKNRTRLETEALVIGYAMSRLDREYLSARHYLTWQQAFDEAAGALAKPIQTFNNLRDEFDPIHPNPRKGWHKRAMRPDRQRVLDELKDVSNEALMELVNRILRRDEEATAPAIDALAVVNRVAQNVAERLLTGRLAEEYFLANAATLIQVANEHILDMRNAACGYDFGIRHDSDRAIEVKGLKGSKGSILFTDREWEVARTRRENYWLLVVGNLAKVPTPRIFQDPWNTLDVDSKYRKTLVVEWHSIVSV